jgi:hypothetical protein
MLSYCVPGIVQLPVSGRDDISCRQEAISNRRMIAVEFLMKRILVIILTLAAAGGCGRANQTAGITDGQLEMARTAEQRGSEFLAYEHELVVDTEEDKLAESFKSVTDACSADRENQCTVLHSEIFHGDYNRASVRMRVKPEGVDALANLAAGSGNVVRRSTQVEDLAKSIADLDKRIAILTTTRDRLLELEDRGAADVDSLIKITTELTRVQADLEQAMGQSAYQRQRIDLDILNIRLIVEAGRSFWGPVSEAISSFAQNLSDGLADTISAIAYLLPWSLLIFFLGYLIRKLWRRGKSS